MEVALHTRLTLVVVDMHPVRVWKMMLEVLTVSWAEFQGTPMAVRLAWAPVVEVGTGEEYQGRRQGRAAGNTGAPAGNIGVTATVDNTELHTRFGNIGVPAPIDNTEAYTPTDNTGVHTESEQPGIDRSVARSRRLARRSHPRF